MCSALCQVSEQLQDYVFRELNQLPFFHRVPFVLLRMTDTETVLIQIRWCLENVFSNNWSEPVASRTASSRSVASDEIQAFKQLLESWRPCICHFPFWMTSVVMLTNMILLSYHEMCKHLENPHNSLKHSFPRDQCLELQNHTWAKGHMECRGGPW